MGEKTDLYGWMMKPRDRSGSIHCVNMTPLSAGGCKPSRKPGEVAFLNVAKFHLEILNEAFPLCNEICVCGWGGS